MKTFKNKISIKLLALVIIFLFLNTSVFSDNRSEKKNKKNNLSPVKFKREINMKDNFVIVKTETFFTKKQWKELKELSKERKKKEKLIKKNPSSKIQLNF
tara:strand:+ start:5414 stop:5713 length:300 start_codon:yes stop_codon:yes gene_type:complete